MGKRFDDKAKVALLGQAEEEAQAWRLRRQAYSIEDIAAELGVSRATAYRRVAAARQAFIDERDANVGAEVAEQLAVLDDVIRTSQALARSAVREVVDPDTGEAETSVDEKTILASADRIMKALDQRAKLTGAYAAVAVDVTATVTHVDAKDAELASMLDKLGPRVETAPQQ